MTVHDIRRRLTEINRRIIYAKQFCTQAAVDQELNGIIAEVCNLGDALGRNGKKVKEE